MPAVDIIGGLILLTLGRKIFWLFVAASGFYAGLELASHYLKGQPYWVTLLIGVVVGLLGAMLAYSFQKLMIGAAGFLAGVFIAAKLEPYLGEQAKSLEWLVILIGGIIGIALMYIIFEWALIILSSLGGAVLIVEGLKLAGILAAIVGAILFIIGIILQTNINRQRAPHRRNAS